MNMAYIQLMVSYLFVITGTFLSIILCILLGCLFLRVIKVHVDITLMYISSVIWVGYTIFISILMFINLFCPVNEITLVIIFSLCAISLVYNYKLFAVFIVRNSTHLSRAKKLIYPVVLGVASILFLKSNFNLGNYAFDTYNYHFSLLRLTNDYPAIKGVVNIFPWLGNIYSVVFHASFLRLFTHVDFLHGYLFLTVSNTLIFALFITLIAQVDNIIKKRLWRSDEFCDRFYYSFVVLGGVLFLAIPFDNHIKFGIYSSGFIRHIPDLNFYVITFSLVLYVVFFIYEKSDINLLTIFSLSLMAILNKLSSVFVVCSIVIMASMIWIRSRNELKKYCLVLIVTVVLFLPYVGQNVVKNGALLFPAASTNLGLKWSNVSALKGYTQGAISWARDRHHSNSRKYSDFRWLPYWCTVHAKFLSVNLAAYGIGGGVLIAFLVLKRKFLKVSVVFLITSITAWCICFCFWFFTAPDIRFSGLLFLFPIMMLMSLINTQYNVFDKVSLSKFLMILIFYLIVIADISVKDSFILVIFFVIFVSFFAGEKGFSKYERAIKNVSVPTVLLLLFIGAFFSAIDTVKLKQPITISNNDSKFNVQIYDGVKIYTRSWDDVPSYTSLHPNTTRIDKDYVFIDAECWWKGMVKRDVVGRRKR